MKRGWSIAGRNRTRGYNPREVRSAEIGCRCIRVSASRAKMGSGGVESRHVAGSAI